LLNRTRLSRVLGLTLVLLGTGAMAQGTGAIIGTLTSAEDRRPLEDAVVTATSPSLQGERTALTDASGHYRLPQLPPGVYTLRVERDGFKSLVRPGVELRLDTTLRFNAELLPESLQAEEEVVVTGRPPTVDVGSNTVGLNIDSRFLQSIPLIRPGSKGAASRSFESLAELAPGANEDRYGVSINGGTSPENQFVVDGLSVNDPSVGTLGTPLSVEFVKEVNVITGGYMPEYGRSTSGVMNVVTKSGSNEFHGSVFASVAPGLLQVPGLEIQQAGSVISAQGRPWNLGQLGLELGGPILRDKLWFFVGLAPSFNRVLIERQLNTLHLCTEVDPENGCTRVGAPQRNPRTGFALTTPIEGTRVGRFADERSFQYLTKLTWLLGAEHNLSLSVFGTPNSSGGAGRYSFGRDGDPEVCLGLSCTQFVQGSYESIATRRANNALGVTARLSSSFLERSLLLDATVGWHHQDSSILPSDGSQLHSGEGLSAQPNITWRRTSRPGLRSITEFESIPDPSLCDEPGTGAVRCPVTTYTTGGPNTISLQSLDRLQGRAVVTYLFSALGHHVLKAGVDAERSSFFNDRARTGLAPWRECLDGTCFFTLNQYGYLEAPDTPVFLPSKVGTSTSLTLGGFLQDSWSVLDTFTVNLGVRYDMQTIWGLDGKVGLHLPDQWSPRLGLSYDFTRQGQSKVFLNYARYYENVPLDMADLSFPQQQLLSSTLNAPPCNPGDPNRLGTDCVAEVNRVIIGNRESPNQLWNAEGGDRVPVDPNIRAQSSDEFVIGAEYELALGRLGVAYTRRYLNDVIEDMSRDDGSTFFIGNPGKGYSTDFPLARRDYDAVNVYYQKSFADLWLAQVSYTWSSLQGNYSGLFRADTGQLSPNLTRDFDLLSLTINRDGPLPGDRTHSLKTFVAREIPLGGRTSLNVGAGYRGRSGAPLNYLGAHPRRSGSETFILPRGSAGRLPWVHNIDAQLNYNQPLGASQTLSFSLEVFNIFNFQEVTAVDQTFTFTRVFPIEDGGSPADLEACRTGQGQCRVLATTNGAPIAASDINPNFNRPTAYQAPLSVRLGARLSF
jgi:outer membrane receptor protein involved in Fe transport